MVAIVPPAATAPVATLSSYPNFFSSGNAILPITAAEAVDAPQAAANPAEPNTVAIARPPGR